MRDARLRCCLWPIVWRFQLVPWMDDSWRGDVRAGCYPAGMVCEQSHPLRNTSETDVRTPQDVVMVLAQVCSLLRATSFHIYSQSKLMFSHTNRCSFAAHISLGTNTSCLCLWSRYRMLWTRQRSTHQNDVASLYLPTWLHALYERRASTWSLKKPLCRYAVGLRHRNRDGDDHVTWPFRCHPATTMSCTSWATCTDNFTTCSTSCGPSQSPLTASSTYSTVQKR